MSNRKNILLAPNGKPSNLNEEQYYLVRTPQFKKWFGDWEKLATIKVQDPAIDEVTLANLSKDVSKVVDQNGEPLVVYHNSDSLFNKFDLSYFGKSDGGYAGVGFYFARKSISGYGKYAYECFLSIKKPLVRNDDNWKDTFMPYAWIPNRANEKNESTINNASKEWTSEAKKMGHDGFIDEGGEIVAFYPNQIKLADGNNTTFDGSNPDIRFDDGGEVKSNSFMKWYIDWYKGVSNKMNIVFSLPNAIQPFKEKNAVILDLFEKKDQTINAKPYLKKIVEKANEYDVVIYLEPKPRHKYFQDNSQKKNKITREYLIDYYEKFGFQLTPNKQFMKRLPHFADGGLIAPNGKKSNLTTEQYKLVRTPEFKAWFGDWENDPANASKVVDQNGEPLVVYHGSKSFDITEFDLLQSKRIPSGLKEFGFYFTDNKKLAEAYRDWSDLKEDEKKLIDSEIYKLNKSLDVVRNNKDYYDIEERIKVLQNSKKGKIYGVFLNLKKMHSFNAKKQTNVGAWDNLKVKASYKIASNRDAMEFLKDGEFDVEKVDGIEAKKIVDAFVQSDELKKDLLSNVYLVFDSKNIKLADGTNTTFDGSNPDIRFDGGGEVNNEIDEKFLASLKNSKCTNPLTYFQLDFVDFLKSLQYDCVKMGGLWYDSNPTNFAYNKEGEIVLFDIEDFYNESETKSFINERYPSEKPLQEQPFYDENYEFIGIGEASMGGVFLDKRDGTILKLTASLYEVVGTTKALDFQNKSIYKSNFSKIYSIEKIGKGVFEGTWYHKFYGEKEWSGDWFAIKRENIKPFDSFKQNEVECVINIIRDFYSVSSIIGAVFLPKVMGSFNLDTPIKKYQELFSIKKSFNNGGNMKNIGHGGITYGESHANGGIKVQNKSTGEMLEVEGGEGVVNKRSMASDKMIKLNGKQMSICEAVSKLNEMEGGVKFSCDDVKHKQFIEEMEFGGELERGIRTEKEHIATLIDIYNRKYTPEKATEMIAKDHLEEDPYYYSKLATIENTSSYNPMVYLDKEEDEITQMIKEQQRKKFERELIMARGGMTSCGCSHHKKYDDGGKTDCGCSDYVKSLPRPKLENGAFIDFSGKDLPKFTGDVTNKPTSIGGLIDIKGQAEANKPNEREERNAERFKMVLSRAEELLNKDYLPVLKDSQQTKYLNKYFEPYNALNLYKLGWRFTINTDAESVGLCEYNRAKDKNKQKRNLYLSYRYIIGDDNFINEMDSVILHEISHAIVAELFFLNEFELDTTQIREVDLKGVVAQIDKFDLIDPQHKETKGHGVTWANVCIALTGGYICRMFYEYAIQNEQINPFMYKCIKCGTEDFGDNRSFAKVCKKCSTPVLIVKHFK